MTFLSKRHKQAALDFSQEAGLEFNPKSCSYMEEKHKIRKLLLSKKIDEAINIINKIDENVQ